MRDYPQNIEQWANEAFLSMNLAWTVLTQTTPFPNIEQKKQLIELAANFACENRDIKDESFIEHARKYSMNEFKVDFESRDLIQEINFALCYVLAYFDAHLSLSMITDEEAQDAISYMKSNYDLSYPEKPQNNVFSVDFSNKS